MKVEDIPMNKVRKVLKITSIVLVVVLVLFLVVYNWSYISVYRYNAKLYDYVTAWIDEDFASANQVGYDGDGPLPVERAFIIDTREKYDEIFVDGLEIEDVNFDKQMVVVYTFMDVYHDQNFITKISLENDMLKITYRLEEKRGVGRTGEEYQHWMVVVMDKVDVDSVAFEEKITYVRRSIKNWFYTHIESK